MPGKFKIKFDGWIDYEVHDPTRSNTLASISLFVDDLCLTEVQDLRSQSTRTSIRVSAYDLAIWFGANFWRLRYETLPQFASDRSIDWQMAHALPATGGGYNWPNLIFNGLDGEFLQLTANQTHRVTPVTTLRYLNAFEGAVDPSSLDDQISRFLELVTARLYARGVYQSPLQELWECLRSERNSVKDAKFRRIEALLGLDPDENGDLVSRLLANWAPKFGRQSVEEFSAASKAEMIEQVLRDVEEKAQRLSFTARVSNLNSLRANIPAFDLNSLKPWEFGRTVAEQVREAWGVGSSPIQDKHFIENLGLPSRELHVDSGLPLSFSANDQNSGAFGFALSRPKLESRRFDLARLLGDQIAFETEDRIRPASAATTVRQKFQRAFAAEFLCPSRIVKERTAQVRTSDELVAVLSQTADEFKVSDAVVEHHFENRTMLHQFD